MEVTAQIHKEDHEHHEKRSKLEEWPLSHVEAADQNTYESSDSKKSSRPSHQRRSSRFIEGSMHDRASKRPPSLYTQNEQAMQQSMVDQTSGASRSSTDSGILLDAGIERSKPSGMFRFGRALANVFNPVYMWNGINGTRKEKREVPSKPHQAIPDERKAKAEREYAELKKQGVSGTQKGSRNRYSFDVSTIKREDDLGVVEPVPYQGSEAELDEYRSIKKTKRNGMIFDARGEEIKSPLLPALDSTTSSLLSGQSSNERSSLNLRRPSLPSLKKVKSHFHLPSSKRSFLTNVSMSSTESNVCYTDLDVNVTKNQQSRKDLHKQQKLSKRVSNLESKLETARRELLEAMHASPSIQDLSSRKTPRSFVPGILPSLPSERALYVQTSEHGQKEKTSFPESVPELISTPAIPNILSQLPSETSISKQNPMDYEKNQIPRNSCGSRSFHIEDTTAMMDRALRIQPQVGAIPPFCRNSSASKVDTDHPLKSSSKTVSINHTNLSPQEIVQTNPEMSLEPNVSLQERSASDSRTDGLEVDTSLGIELNQSIGLNLQSANQEDSATSPADIQTKAKTASQATPMKPRAKKRKSSPSYKPKDDDSDDDEYWKPASKSSRKSRDTSLGSLNIEKRASPRSGNVKKSSKIRKNDSPNSIKKPKSLKALKTNSPLSAKIKTSPKIKKEAVDASSKPKKRSVEGGGTIFDPIDLENGTSNLQVLNESQVTASEILPVNDAEPLEDVSKVEHEPRKPCNGPSALGEPFDPAKVDKAKLISMRSNPNSTAAFGWVSDDISNLKKEFPNMTQGQLTKYISMLFNDDQKPSTTTPRTVRKAPSIANQRLLIKRASLSPVKQPFQSIMHDARPCSPERWSSKTTRLDVSPAHDYEKMQLGKSPSSYEHTRKAKMPVNDSLADLISDPNTVTISPSKDKNVPPVPPVPKGFEGYAAKVFTEVTKEDYQWDDDVF